MTRPGSAITERSSGRLLWREEAAVFAPSGDRVARRGQRGGGAVLIPDTPAAEAITAIYPGGIARRGFCVAPPGYSAERPFMSPARPSLCCLTSGTSGTPRMIERSQQSWCASIRQNAGTWRIGAHDSYAVLGALSHSLALYAAAEALHLGADLHLLAGVRPDRQAARLGRAAVSILYATPAQARLLPEPPGGVWPGLRLILIGGARLDAETRNRLCRFAPNARLHEFYGASETSFITLSDSDTPEGSVGRAYPGVSISVRDDGGQRVRPGRTGEIWVESPYLFSRYLRGATGDTRRRGRALTIGEFGRLDADGYLWLAGRRGRMVTIADRNVFPEEVETCLLGLSGIARAAVLARPDEQRGHRLIACIDADDGLSDDDILKHCRARLGPLKAPRLICRPVPFPVLASGKPDLRALKAVLSGGAP